MDTKKEVFRERLGEYLKASKQEKGKILNALEITTGLRRKGTLLTGYRVDSGTSWKRVIVRES